MRERLRLAKADDHIVLPEIISKEPLGPAVRHGDDQWFDIVKWTHYAMVNAEELGITKANVDEQMKSDNPDVKRLLGSEGNHGEALGLTNDWAYRIIKQVGNYGEVFERNVGQGSPLKIARGLNALWTKGGLQYAPPIALEPVARLSAAAARAAEMAGAVDVQPRRAEAPPFAIYDPKVRSIAYQAVLCAVIVFLAW